eukprot:COSAG01_NODE_513_length_16049_cov_57.758056_6_plen_163_part_00
MDPRPLRPSPRLRGRDYEMGGRNARKRAQRRVRAGTGGARQGGARASQATVESAPPTRTGASASGEQPSPTPPSTSDSTGRWRRGRQVARQVRDLLQHALDTFDMPLDVEGATRPADYLEGLVLTAEAVRREMDMGALDGRPQSSPIQNPLRILFEPALQKY